MFVPAFGVQHSTFRFQRAGVFPLLLFSLLLPFSSFAASNSVDSSALQLWHLDENTGTTATDAVSGRKADLKDGATWTKGKVGNAVKLDGTKGKIVMQDAEGWIPLAGDESFTVDAWVKVFKQGETQQIVSCTPHYEMEVRSENGAVSFNLQPRDGSTPVRCTGQTNVTDGKWHHVATVRDAKQKKLQLYIDDVIDAEVDDLTAGKEVGLHRHAVFGGRAGDDRETLGGIIDEVRISRGVREFGNAQE